MITIVTGISGVGKTTHLLKLIEKLAISGLSPSGIMTPAIFNEAGGKVGFFALDVATGKKWELGRSDRTLDGPSYGPFSFSERGFVKANKILKQVLTKGTKDLILDEIGPLELEKGYGFLPILPYINNFSSNRNVYLVIRQSLIDDFIRRFIPKTEYIIVEITAKNRERIIF